MLRRGLGFVYERIQPIFFGHVKNPVDIITSVTIKSARESIRDDKKCSRRVRGHEVSSVVEPLLFCVTPHHARPRDFVGSAVGEGDSPCRALHLNSYLRRNFKVMCLCVSRSGHQLEPIMGVDEMLQRHNEKHTGHFDGFFPQRTVETSSLRQFMQAHAGYRSCSTTTDWNALSK